jgi:nucleotide-binding universal stress UspA family protein
MASSLRHSNFACALLAINLLPFHVSAETPIAHETPARDSTGGSLVAYRAHMVALREVIVSCRHTPSECVPARVGPDDRVFAQEEKPAFDVHWSWLWETILKAKDAKLENRDALLSEADARLVDQLHEAGVDVSPASISPPEISLRQARRNADAILAGSEFRHISGNGFWEQLSAKLLNWLGRIFGGVSNLGQHAPWLGAVIMYGFILLAFSGLLVWVFRLLDRQRVAVRLHRSAAINVTHQSAKNWAALAEKAAAEEDWREAVHAMYWATVSELESRRLWRQADVRTPREYLRLVPHTAPQYQPLRSLTMLLERIWYGLGSAAKSDYHQARMVYDEMRQS